MRLWKPYFWYYGEKGGLHMTDSFGHWRQIQAEIAKRKAADAPYR